MIVGWAKLPSICSDGKRTLDERKIRNQRNSQMGIRILHQVLLRYYGIDLSEEETPIGRMEKGKPYLTGHPEIHFNISHSEELVACVVANTPVGIDVQYQDVSKLKILAKRVLSQEEWSSLEKSGFDENVFFQYWTKKESYLKYTGEGIRSDLREMTYEGGRFYEWEPCPGYKGMVCVSEECLEDIKFVNDIMK